MAEAVNGMMLDMLAAVAPARITTMADAGRPEASLAAPGGLPEASRQAKVEGNPARSSRR
jgi:hypothetical protein